MNIPPDVQASQSADALLAESWGYFDRIFCISLSSRPDRRKFAEQEFRRVGLADRVEFIIVDRHSTDSEQGIFESHMGCLSNALVSGAQAVLVFEDDVRFSRFSRDVLRQSVQFMKTDADWELFFLGCFVNRSRRTRFPSVIQIRFRCLAHAYVAHRRMAQQLVQQPWRGIAYDDLLRSMAGENVYAAYPSFAFQSGAATDNDKRLWIDRARRLIGGQQFLQKWNEFNTLYFSRLVVIHVLIVLAMVLFAVAAHRGHWFKHEPLDFLFRRNR